MFRFQALLQLFLLIFFGNIVAAHNKTDAHNDCLYAKDYIGCIRHLQYKTIPITSNTSESNSLYRYGPLRVLWKWRKASEFNYVARILNNSNKTLYLAINCDKRMINVTGLDNKWQGWEFPYKDFEASLVRDFCNYQKTLND